MNLELRSLALYPPTGNHTFEAGLTAAPAVRCPNATVIPDRAEGAVRPDGSLSWVTLVGPVSGRDPRSRANWTFCRQSPYPGGALDSADPAAREVIEVLHASVLTALRA